MKEDSPKSFSKWTILLPTIIGIGVIAYMFQKEFNFSDLKLIPLNAQFIIGLSCALLFMIGRDAGFTIRYRYLTEKRLSWVKCLKVTLLAEFGSAITPSTVGGSSMAILFLAKEKISVGQSTTMVFVTILLDEMFFITTFPILLVFIPFHELFYSGNYLTNSVLFLFAIAYTLKVLLCMMLIIGLFFKPTCIKYFLFNVFKIKPLRKWQKQAVKTGNDLITSSKDLKGKSYRFWLPLIFSTILSWCSRYLVINALFMAFFHVDNQLLVFARQFVMWVVMLISPTPGGAGLSEFIFNQYLANFIPVAGFIPIIILLWRLLTYYNYLFIGAFLVPKWIKTSFKS